MSSKRIMETRLQARTFQACSALAACRYACPRMSATFARPGSLPATIVDSTPEIQQPKWGAPSRMDSTCFAGVAPVLPLQDQSPNPDHITIKDLWVAELLTGPADLIRKFRLAANELRHGGFGARMHSACVQTSKHGIQLLHGHTPAKNNSN